jgi:hypothetical protein
LCGLSFDPKDGEDMFLRKTCWHSKDYAVSYCKLYLFEERLVQYSSGYQK